MKPANSGHGLHVLLILEGICDGEHPSPTRPDDMGSAQFHLPTKGLHFFDIMLWHEEGRILGNLGTAATQLVIERDAVSLGS